MATSSFRYGSAGGEPSRSKSRFSKALPAPPPPAPVLPSSATAQKVGPSPIVQRPLPPQPKSIPRRPVGAPATVSSSSHSRNLSDESVSSLFSLYKDSPWISPSPSVASKVVDQSVESKVMSSPLPPLPKNNNMSDETSNLPKNSNVPADRGPILPQKDDNSRKAEVGSQSPPSRLHSASTSSADSFSKQKIWRRRSIRSDQNPSIANLKLTESNGFTSDSPVIAQSTLPPGQTLPDLSTQPLQAPRASQASQASQAPRTIPAGLPGRNIRKQVSTRPNPDETAQAIPDPPDKASMGQKLSTMVRKIDASRENEQGANAAASTTAPTLSPITRLPTPEYQQADKKLFQPITPQVIPPSPETSPSDMIPPSPQAAALPVLSTRSDPSMATLVDNPGASTPKGPGHTSNASSSSHASEASSSSNSSTIKPVVSPFPPRKQSMQSRTQPLPRAVQRPILTPSNPGPSEPAPTDPALSAFPFNTLTPAAPGTIFTPARLSSSHFNCYQSHRSMRMSRNNMYPLACMACNREDAEKRWMCTWCCLRCCEGCLKTLSNVPGRDLKLTLEKIGKAGPGNVLSVR